MEARQKREAVSPADGPEDRWLTERCILFGATVPMLPEPYNNNYRIIQSPGYVTILVEMNHDARVIPSTGGRISGAGVQQWTGDSRGRWEGTRSWSRPRTSSSTIRAASASDTSTGSAMSGFAWSNASR